MLCKSLIKGESLANIAWWLILATYKKQDGLILVYLFSEFPEEYSPLPHLIKVEYYWNWPLYGHELVNPSGLLPHSVLSLLMTHDKRTTFEVSTSSAIVLCKSLNKGESLANMAWWWILAAFKKLFQIGITGPLERKMTCSLNYSLQPSDSSGCIFKCTTIVLDFLNTGFYLKESISHFQTSLSSLKEWVWKWLLQRQHFWFSKCKDVRRSWWFELQWWQRFQICSRQHTDCCVYCVMWYFGLNNSRSDFCSSLKILKWQVFPP